MSDEFDAPSNYVGFLLGGARLKQCCDVGGEALARAHHYCATGRVPTAGISPSPGLFRSFRCEAVEAALGQGARPRASEAYLNNTSRKPDRAQRSPRDRIGHRSRKIMNYPEFAAGLQFRSTNLAPRLANGDDILVRLEIKANG